MKNEELIELLAECVHMAYCQYCSDIKGQEYWTQGDYSRLDDKTKEADRYTVRAVLKGMKELGYVRLADVRVDGEKVKYICEKLMLDWIDSDKRLSATGAFSKELSNAIAAGNVIDFGEEK